MGPTHRMSSTIPSSTDTSSDSQECAEVKQCKDTDISSDAKMSMRPRPKVVTFAEPVGDSSVTAATGEKGNKHMTSASSRRRIAVLLRALPDDPDEFMRTWSQHALSQGCSQVQAEAFAQQYVDQVKAQQEEALNNAAVHLRDRGRRR